MEWSPPEFSNNLPPNDLTRVLQSEIENVDYVLFMVDIALIGTDPDELNDVLQCFRHVIQGSAIKDIILVFQNHSLPHEPHDYRTILIGYIVGRFSSLNEDKSREIHTIFVDDGDSAVNLACLQDIVQSGLRSE